MFKPHHGYCIECKQESIIAVKKGYCQKCNWEQKQAKKKAAGKKSGKYQYVKKATGEGVLFEQVLNNLPDTETKCFVCGKRVAIVTHNNMAHVLAKGRFPKYRLNPANLRVMCFNIQGTGCHSLYDHHPHSELKGEGWERLFELRDKLREEYKNNNGEWE